MAKPLLSDEPPLQRNTATCQSRCHLGIVTGPNFQRERQDWSGPRIDLVAREVSVYKNNELLINSWQLWFKFPSVLCYCNSWNYIKTETQASRSSWMECYPFGCWFEEGFLLFSRKHVLHWAQSLYWSLQGAHTSHYEIAVSIHRHLASMHSIWAAANTCARTLCLGDLICWRRCSSLERFPTVTAV